MTIRTYGYVTGAPIAVGTNPVAMSANITVIDGATRATTTIAVGKTQ
jgi:hypothetical protein